MGGQASRADAPLGRPAPVARGSSPGTGAAGRSTPGWCSAVPVPQMMGFAARQRSSEARASLAGYCVSEANSRAVMSACCTRSTPSAWTVFSSVAKSSNAWATRRAQAWRNSGVSASGVRDRANSRTSGCRRIRFSCSSSISRTSCSRLRARWSGEGLPGLPARDTSANRPSVATGMAAASVNCPATRKTSRAVSSPGLSASHWVFKVAATAASWIGWKLTAARFATSESRVGRQPSFSSRMR